MFELLALLISWGLTAYLWYKNRSKYKNRIFLDKINFSLNEITKDGKLLMRTLEERSADDVWQSSVAVNMVAQAAKETTETEPFLQFEDPEDLNFMKRCALNTLSTRFASAFVARSVGLPIKAKNFVYGITCEKYPRIRKQKIRIMVVAEEQLIANLQGDFADCIDTEGKFTREDRVKTLKRMAELYTKEGCGNGKTLGLIELGVSSS